MIEDPRTARRMAEALARGAHAGQRDKAGRPYFQHLEWVEWSRWVKNDRERAIAVLHDVMEDTPIKVADLQELGFDMSIVMGVGILTKDEGEKYEDYIARVSDYNVTTRIKYADIMHHLEDTTHISEAQVRKYREARSQLEEAWRDRHGRTRPLRDF